MPKRNLLVLAAAIVFIAALGTACPNPYVAAYKSLAAVKLTAEATRDGLYGACHLKRVSCWKANGSVKNAAYDKCWAECRKAEENWVKVIRPAVNTGLIAGDASIQVAKIAKTKPDWLAIVKPIACALASGMQQWQHLLPPPIKAKAETITVLVMGVACPAPAAVEEKRPETPTPSPALRDPDPR
jgi:hypothetical protein